jgi:hypothetical protein
VTRRALSELVAMGPGTVAYVAHPVAGDVAANLARALRWLFWLSSQCPDVAVIAPWIAGIMSGEDDGDPAARSRWLALDVAIVKRCDCLILCGGRVSSGMAIERDAMIAVHGKVIDLTHLGDEPPSALILRGCLVASYDGITCVVARDVPGLKIVGIATADIVVGSPIDGAPISTGIEMRFLGAGPEFDLSDIGAPDVGGES